MQQYRHSSIHLGVNLYQGVNLEKLATVCYLIFLLSTSTVVMAQGHKQLKAVLQGNGDFTKHLYQVLAKSPDNVFFSPISIHAVLAMAYQGSEEKTKEAFTNVLGIPDTTVAAEGYHEIMNRLNSVQNITLLMANKIFLKQSYLLQDTFKSVVTKQFLSEVENIDFAKSDAAAKTINTWVENKTNNKIKDLIQAGDLNSLTRLVLVNAIYFKGKWAEPFDPKLTTTEKFYVNNEESIDVQMMHITKKFYYKSDENLDAKILELPYANKDISMIIILPNKRDGINELEQKLANVDLTKITENMYRPEVMISLPKFKMETTIDLKDSLTQLGLGVIFEDNANFSKMLQSPEPLTVSKVIQKAFIEVNEEGAEAAAATGMVMIQGRRLPRDPEEFNIDHPFIILLASTQRNMCNILFEGRILNP